MMTSYFNLLKYAATGQASPSMTYFDKMRASTLMGGAVQTLTGQPPLTFKADGKPLISWSMKGNGSQSGTPTPDNPVMPTFCGVRTGNLFDYTRTDGITDNYYIDQSGQTVYYDGYYISYPIKAESNVRYTWRFNSNSTSAVHTAPSVAFYDNDGELLSVASHATSIKFFSFTTPSNCAYIKCSVYKRNGVQSEAMLNLGSTALPYEPYGWAEKITCAGQTTPVYLGEVPTVRRIKKLVLTGKEGWAKYLNTSYYTRARNYYRMHDIGRNLSVCSHYPINQSDIIPETHYGLGGLVDGSTDTVWNGNIVFNPSPMILSLTDWKTYLAAQYAAGTPVTVWYILAEPETAIVNEPLAKIGDYADELHSTDAGVSIPTIKGQNTLTVGGDLQPSEMTITFKG